VENFRGQRDRERAIATFVIPIAIAWPASDLTSGCLANENQPRRRSLRVLVRFAVRIDERPCEGKGKKMAEQAAAAKLALASGLSRFIELSILANRVSLAFGQRCGERDDHVVETLTHILTNICANL